VQGRDEIRYAYATYSLLIGEPFTVRRELLRNDEFWPGCGRCHAQWLSAVRLPLCGPGGRRRAESRDGLAGSPGLMGLIAVAVLLIG